jgi:carbon-monoxide dehydrogenase large subunit
MSLVNRYIGAPIKRVEDLRFLRGRGEFVADLASAETLHAAILRSPVAKAGEIDIRATASLNRAKMDARPMVCADGNDDP